MTEQYRPDLGLDWHELIDVRADYEPGLEGNDFNERLTSEAKNLDIVIEHVGLSLVSETLLFKRNNLITPKAVRIHEVAEAGEELGFIAEAHSLALIQGRANPVFEDDLWGSRSVHYPEKVTFAGQEYFLDIKGLGKNGKRLYSWHHGEGDPFFGIYLDGARREFQIPQVMIEAGLTDIQVPVFYGEIPEDEYVRHSTIGLYETLSARLGFVFGHENTVEKGLQNYPSPISLKDRVKWGNEGAFSLAAHLSIEMFDAYQQSGTKGIENWAEKYDAREEVAVLLSGRKFGVTARLIKATDRVAGVWGVDYLSEQNIAIAKRAGEISRVLLEEGFWATSPSPANWTTAGEFIDFEDVIRWPQDEELIRADMKFRDLETLEQYISYTFGEGCLGDFKDDFQRGFMNGSATDAELMSKAKELIGI